MPRNSQAGAALTRSTILDQATALGSIQGLEALSIGALAKAAHISRSGVMGHFGSKEELQLATLAAAVESFRTEVWLPVEDHSPGIRRLRGTMDAWLSYLEREVFPGGCFLTAVSLEFDGRPGRVRDAIASVWQRWLGVLERDIATAQADGDLPTDDGPAQIAIELLGHVMACNWGIQLFKARPALAAARTAIARRLEPPRAAAVPSA